MTIARIQIDFHIHEGEDLEAFLEYFGDHALAVLDPHEDGDECVRWVSVEAYQCEEDDYPIDIDADEIEDFLALPDDLRDNAEYN